MNIVLHLGSILEIEADALICSANVSLNLTGGVGADIVEQYGTQMQKDLHDLLRRGGKNYAKQGEVYPCFTEGLPYKLVVHAVAVDPLYHSTIDVITDVVNKSFELVQNHKVKSVALTCLASGFGDLSLDDFVQGLAKVIEKDWSPLETIYLAQIEPYRFKELEESVLELRSEVLDGTNK